MFLAWGRFVYRSRYAVIIGFVALVGLSGLYGLDLSKRLTQEGWFDESSESVKGSKLADSTFGRDTDADVIALYTVPEGKSVDDPEIGARARALFDRLRTANAAQVLKIDSYWDTSLTSAFADESHRHAFASIGLRAKDAGTLDDYNAIKDKFAIEGTRVQLAGLQPVVYALNEGMQRDIHRAELIALPLVAILLYFVFGGVVAALLPVIIGGLTIAGSQGLMRLETNFIDVNAFATAVVTLVSLGLAIDYGLFMVSRFREEMAQGRTVEEAVSRSVAAAGRTIVFSASIIVVCLGGLLIYPHPVLKSVPYGAISSVALAAALSVSVLPSVLGILGRRVDLLSWKRFSQSKTPEQIDNGFWSRLAIWSMKRPRLIAGALIVLLLALIIPFGGMKFAGLSERYLAPTDSARVAQEEFDRIFPQFRTEPMRLVIVGADNEQLGEIRAEANEVGGLTSQFEATEQTKDGINVLEAGLIEKSDADRVITQLRAIPKPEGVRVYVAGIPALEQDSIHGLTNRLPMLLVILIIASIALMYLAFRSIVLAIKAIVVSALSLGSTLGILTWIFVDGHGAGLLGFTAGPLMLPVLIVIVTVVFGLSTDYEVFLMSRMVEAHENGADTPEAIRFGIARTGGVITAAASILIVVTGAFALSDLVLMKCLAYGMIAALILDATIIRMLLVPAIMRILGDWCWWTPSARARITPPESDKARTGASALR